MPCRKDGGFSRISLTVSTVFQQFSGSLLLFTTFIFCICFLYVACDFHRHRRLFTSHIINLIGPYNHRVLGGPRIFRVKFSHSFFLPPLARSLASYLTYERRASDCSIVMELTCGVAPKSATAAPPVIVFRSKNRPATRWPINSRRDVAAEPAQRRHSSTSHICGALCITALLLSAQLAQLFLRPLIVLETDRPRRPFRRVLRAPFLKLPCLWIDNCINGGPFIVTLYWPYVLSQCFLLLRIDGSALLCCLDLARV